MADLHYIHVANQPLTRTKTMHRARPRYNQQFHPRVGIPAPLLHRAIALLTSSAVSVLEGPEVRHMSACQMVALQSEWLARNYLNKASRELRLSSLAS